MVLRSGVWLVLAASALMATGCLKRSPIPRLPEPQAIAVAFVMDSDYERSANDVPEALKREVKAQLALRNLVLEEIPYASLDSTFDAVRDSTRRFQAVQRATPEAKLRLLVEVKADYFNQLAGRYSWTVYGRATAGLAEESSAPTSEEMTFSAQLQYQHERAERAIVEVASSISERAVQVVDALLALPSDTGADSAAPGAAELGSGQEKAAPGAMAAPRGDAIYFVLVDRFENGDRGNDGAVDPKDPAAFHGGDLQGVLDRLDDLHALGVRTVWLSPVFQMRTAKFFEHGAFHGYWVEDIRKVEPKFGDEALLAKLSDALHARGMRLVLDIVLNHVGPGAPLTRTHPQWFNGKGPLVDWNDPVQLVSHDVHGLPDLNTENEEVYRFLLDASVEWIRKVRPDGFRLDAVKHLPLSFWARFNADVRRVAGEDFVLLGEMLDGDAALLARTQQAGKFGQMFDFPLAFALVDVFCRNRTPEHLGAVLFNDRLYPDSDSLVTLLDNHDLPRITSLCGEELAKVEQALAVQLTARGTPALTYGTEVGLTGETEPANRGDMKFDRGHRLWSWISRVLAARRESEALQRGVNRVLASGEGFFAYARVVEREAVIVAINGSDSARKLPLLERTATARDLLSGEMVRGELEVAAKSVRIVQVEPATGDGFAALVQHSRRLWRGEGAKREVALRVSGPRLLHGETLHVIGSAPELGSWNPAKAPLASGTVLLPEGGVYEYKLVVRGPHGKVRWQDGPNQILFLAREAKSPVMTASW